MEAFQDRFNIFLENITSTELYFSFILLIIAITAAITVHYILFRVIRSFVHHSKIIALEKMVMKFKKPMLLLLIQAGILIVMPMVQMSTGLTSFVNHFLSIITILAVAWLLIKGVSIGKVLFLKNYDIETEDNLQARKVHTQFRMLERIMIVIIVMIAFGTALMTFEKIRQIGMSLLASAGIAGIILGFAAQKGIATILAGFQLAITQPIRIDDVVIVEGEWGRIEEIKLTYVVVRIWDERRLIVPTTHFIEKPFQNWTLNSAQLLGTVYIYTDFRIPVDEIRKELTRILENNDKWDQRVNVVQVTNATEKTMEVRALLSSPNSGDAWDLRVYVREKLIEFIRDNYPESLPVTRVVLENTNEEKMDFYPGKPKR